MLQLLDLARENAQLKGELCRIQAEVEALQRLLAALGRTWPDMRCRTPSRKEEASPSDLIFEALCLRYRSSTNVSKVMTRQDLREATGLPAEALVEALRELVRPVNEDLATDFVNHDRDQITIWPAWASRCEDDA